MRLDTGRAMAGCEAATEGLIYFMIVFSPWAFGTTASWSVWTMDLAGYGLGLLWAAKILLRRGQKTGAPAAPAPDWGTRAMGLLTVLFLGYCLTSALNSRATFAGAQMQFEYRECIAWLPHSYDRPSSLQAFWNYLALALAFWAVRDWLSGEKEWRPFGESEAARQAWRYGVVLTPRLRRLLWVLCLNGTALAVESLAQRASGTTKLLWLVEPRIHKDPAQQLGPYAYRSNGAQYFAMVWPLAAGFWWMLHMEAPARPRAEGVRQRHVLLSCAVAMAVCPLLSHSRAGVIVGLAGMIIAGWILAGPGRLGGWRWGLGITAALAGTAFLGLSMYWETVVERMGRMGPEFMEMRMSVYRTAWQMALDFPVLGTGPDTFEPVYQLYRGSPDEFWAAQAHCDWLEMWITLGAAGMALVLPALGLALTRWFRPGGLVAHRVFAGFLWLAAGGCLAHSVIDFPFTIYSLLFLFLVLCAILFSISRRDSLLPG